jgi:hypothetical protein
MKFESRTEVIMNNEELCTIDEAILVLKALSKQMAWENNETLICETKSNSTEHGMSEVTDAITLLEDIMSCNQVFVE